MKKFIGIFVLSLLAVLFGIYQSASGLKEYTPMWPNLPAPIGSEPILITSAGQGAEGAVTHLMVKRLNLNANYRPRALATDIYDYETILIYIGYSKNGVKNAFRNFKEEKERIKRIVTFANHQEIPVILIHPGGSMRDDSRTIELIKEVLPLSDYFIGKRKMDHGKDVLEMSIQHKIPITLVKETRDMLTPLNSVFR